MSIEENGRRLKFYSLELELEKVNALPLSWTLVHPITEESPLYQFTKMISPIRKVKFVFVKTFDDMFSNTVATRTPILLKK
jgi:inward rectifier potassium channel